MNFSRQSLILLLAFVAGASAARSAAAAQAYVIADAQTGYILEEQEPRKKLQVGSLTKIATAMTSANPSMCSRLRRVLPIMP